MEKMKILGVNVHPLTMEQSVAYLEDRLVEGEKAFVVTANAEIIMMCQHDAKYNRIVEEMADLVLPDGAGAVWAGRHLGYTVPERVAGFDLYLRLMELSSKKGYKAFFFGSSPGVAEAAKAKCEAMYPGAQVVGLRNGYFTQEDVPQIIEEINASGAEMLFCALGAPKQEYWIAEHLEQLKPKIIMGIGGSFDVLAGKMERAPKWMQDASLEWLFRLYKQPSRFIRMMALPKFALKVIFKGEKKTK